MKAATVYNGLAVTVGSKVVYPGRRGSSLWLNQGVVEDIDTIDGWSGEHRVLKIRRKANSDWEQDGKLVTVYNLENVVPING
jgi:hypothetical protein